MAGYTRQSLAAIQDGEDIVAAPLNAEFDQLQDAFNAITGHTHDGTIGNGPKLALGGAVSGTLPVTNGGTGLNTIAIDQILYSSALNVLSPTPITAFARTLIDDIDALTARATLGVTIGTQVQAWDAGLQSISGLTTAADKMIYTTALDTYAVTDLSPFARTILDDTTALAVRTTIDSINATNLTTGTVADARLPTSMAGKTFTSAVTISAGGMSVTGAISTNTNITVGGSTYQTDGNIVFSGGMLFYGATLAAGFDSKANRSGDTFTGNIAFPESFATGGNMYIRSSSNRHLWFQSNTGLNRGLLYHDNASEFLDLQLYNSAGTFVRSLNLGQNGNAVWRGPQFEVGFNSGSAEYRLNAGSGFDHRIINNTGGELYIQRSTDEWAGSTTLLQWNSSNTAIFPGIVQINSTLNLIGASNGLEVGARGVSNTPFIDFHSSAVDSDYNVRLIASGGTGAVGSGTLTLSAASFIFGGNLTVGSAIYQTDGNIQFTGGMLVHGVDLNTALAAKAGYSTSSTQDETSFPVGQLVGINSAALPRRTSVVPRLHTQNEFYIDSGAGAILGGTWRACGRTDANGAMYLIQRTA